MKGLKLETSRRILGGFAVFSALAVSSCGSSSVLTTGRNVGPCPVYGAVYDASRVINFNGDTQLYSNIEYSGEIAGVRLFCRYIDDDPIATELEIDFAFGKGPKAGSDTVSFPFFVAVTRSTGKVLAKEHFTVEARFDDNEVVSSRTVLVDRLRIPRSDRTISGSNFEVLVGFDLTDEQLAFNRSGSRFRLDAADALRDRAG